MRLSYVAVVWMLLWGAFGASVSLIAGVVDPVVVGPGEGPGDFAIGAGRDGLLTGLAFGLLLLAAEHRRRVDEIPVLRAVGWAVLAVSAWVCIALARAARRLPCR